MNQLVLAARQHGALAAVLVLTLAGGVYWYYATPPEEEVFQVTRGDFVQEVSASGKVTPAEAVDLGFSQGGRIARVAVSVGDTVQKGELLATIENGDARAVLSQREAALLTERAKLAEMQAGTRQEELAVTASDVQGKEAALVLSRQSLIEAVQEGYVAAHNALYNNIDPFVLNPRSATPQLLFSVEDSNLATDFTKERARVEQLFLGWKPITSAILDTDLMAAVRQARENLATLSDLLSLSAIALSRAVPTTAYPASTIAGYASDVAGGRTATQNAISGVTTAETSYRSAETALATARSTFALEQAGETPTGIAAQAARVRAAEADVANAAALLAKTEIRAPFEGTVTAVDAKVGESIGSAQFAVSLIGLGSLEIESYVPEINIALLSIGDPARITLDAYGDVVFPSRIVSIDPAETVRDGVSTYRVILAFDTPDPRVRSGMTANVVIVTDERSNVISIPQGLVHTKGSAATVSVREGGVLVEREVTTGAISSSGDIEITSGLREGDILPISE